MTTATAPAATHIPPSTATAVTCPGCHTVRVGVTNDTFDTGGQWRCERCGGQWTRSRLATLAEYEAWALEQGRSS